jgi:hypothetical protein
LRVIHCDGCTVEATPEHLRQRIARLEWASRYRPVHIAMLVLAPAPPAALEDYFYAPEALPREPGALAFYEDLLAACGFTAGGERKEDPLAKFQHAGLFLADAVECPVAEGAEEDLDSLIARLTPTVVRRVQFSYRPKSAVVLSERLAGVTRALGEAGIKVEALPVAIARAEDLAGRERFRAQVRGLVAGANAD